MISIDVFLCCFFKYSNVNIEILTFFIGQFNSCFFKFIHTGETEILAPPSSHVCDFYIEDWVSFGLQGIAGVEAPAKTSFITEHLWYHIVKL